MHSAKLLGSNKSGHSKRSDRLTVKILTMVIRVQDGRAGCCLNWNIYDIGVNYEFTSMQKINAIAKISCYFSGVSLH